MPVRLRTRERELASLSRPAVEMYTGRQHAALMAGVERLRTRVGFDAVTLQVVSAGYGLIEEARVIVPYDVTFSGMRSSQACDWARELHIPGDIRAAVRRFPLVIFLLGDRYLRAIEPPLIPASGQRLVFLAKPSDERRLRQSHVTLVPAGEPARRRYGTTMIALKGEMFDLFARGFVEGGASQWESICSDDTAATFTRVMDAGRRSR